MKLTAIRIVSIVVVLLVINDIFSTKMKVIDLALTTVLPGSLQKHSSLKRFLPATNNLSKTIQETVPKTNILEELNAKSKRPEPTTYEKIDNTAKLNAASQKLEPATYRDPTGEPSTDIFAGIPLCERKFCEPQTQRSVLFAIKSPANRAAASRRNLIRQTFTHQVLQYPNASYAFVLSSPDLANFREGLEEEQERHSDLVVLEHLDETRQVSIYIAYVMLSLHTLIMD
jgi:hypothetical protein